MKQLMLKIEIKNKMCYAPCQEGSYLIVWFISLIKSHVDVVILYVFILFVLPLKKKGAKFILHLIWKSNIRQKQNFDTLN